MWSRRPEPMTRSAELLDEFTGDYDTIAMSLHLTSADGGLVAETTAKPSFLAERGVPACLRPAPDADRDDRRRGRSVRHL